MWERQAHEVTCHHLLCLRHMAGTAGEEWLKGQASKSKKQEIFIGGAWGESLVFYSSCQRLKGRRPQLLGAEVWGCGGCVFFHDQEKRRQFGEGSRRSLEGQPLAQPGSWKKPAARQDARLGGRLGGVCGCTWLYGNLTSFARLNLQESEPGRGFPLNA